MPELPEVETIARKLALEIQDRTITDVDVLWQRTVDRPSVAAFKEALTNTSVDRVRRRGKFLVMELNTAQSLLVHLRMSGRFSIQPTGAGRHAETDDRVHKHARLRLELDNEDWLVYVDPRKFGRFYLVDDPQELVGDLGPEPLDPAFTAQTLHANLVNRRGEIKRLLLNQHFIAGLGNIYVSEALWQAEIHPRRSAGSLSEDEARRLHRAIRDVLAQGIRNGGTSLEDRQYTYPDGGTGNHQNHLNVYDRAGETCPRCGYMLERIVQGQRSTYLCPVCQPDPDRS
ncbi:MAG: bifunctional DNA-formamidopyrimidine glycosylase/DNA-(apurinic or apyrimidinic site) lyase [Anaerolineae bacterium]|nr:bifunctional DNA-formamidopyrimidine glycosylase/DNA-(apurinic or apyrimidinic site) lyase [Anaerolineae bacterium]